ncbi:MAG: GntR family transcriptional regulator [Sedimentisphaeraceae bacterium JB056]
MIKVLDNIDIDTRPGKNKPIYEQVAEHIKLQINSSGVKAGMRLPAISEMMKEWNIAYPTIKNALDLLEQENLIKCEAGRGKGPVVLKNDNKEVLKFAFHRWCNDAQFLNLEKGISDFVDANGYEMKVVDSSFAHPYNPDVLVAESEGVDGLIVYPIDTKEYIASLKKVQKKGVKIVFVDRFFLNLDISSACVDNFSGGYIATNHLIDQHDCPVYYFGHTGRPSSSHLRHQGWYQAMKEHFTHLDFANDYLWEIPLAENQSSGINSTEWEKPAYEKGLKLIESVTSDKCCVFCTNDDAARVISEAARDHGWCLGENFFVVGFGDKPYCERMDVPLSSVAQFDEKVGYEAAKLLESIIGNPSLAYQRINRIVPVELKVRQSSVGVIG